MGGGTFEFDSEREGLGYLLDPIAHDTAEGPPLEVELGSLVAALSAVLEDETELELCLRTVVESSAYRIRVGDGAPKAESVRPDGFERDELAASGEN